MDFKYSLILSLAVFSIQYSVFSGKHNFKFLYATRYFLLFVEKNKINKMFAMPCVIRKPHKLSRKRHNFWNVLIIIILVYIVTNFNYTQLLAIFL